MAAQALRIDGSMLEGGGQILRMAAGLAVITNQEIEIVKIRQGREKPGLRPQHLAGLQLLQRMCDGRLEGGAVGSSAILLRPGALRGGSFSADAQTAGSCALMVQAALPCLFFAGGEGCVNQLSLKGGTDADKAPPMDYLQHVLVPLLHRLCRPAHLQIQTVCRGFFPRGGGHAWVTAGCLPQGQSFPAFDLTQRGRVTRVEVRAYSAGRAPAAAAQQLAAAVSAGVRRGLRRLGEGNAAVEEVVAREVAGSAVGDGCGVLAVAESDTGCRWGASARTQKGIPTEATGDNVAEELLAALSSGACTDEWLQDQLIVYMALAAGTSKMLTSGLTLHTRTAMVVAEQLLPGARFCVEDRPLLQAGGPPLQLVRCQGAGVVPLSP